MVVDTAHSAVTPAPALTDIEAVTAAFLAQVDAVESSRKLYARTLRQYFEWVRRTRRELATLTRADIIKYRDDLLAGYEYEDSETHQLTAVKPKGAYTVSSYMGIVKMFYTWAAANCGCINIADGVKVSGRQSKFKRDYLTAEQAGQLLSAAHSGADLRNIAIINLMLRTGLRTIEVVRANYGDMATKGGRHILYVQGKGHAEKDNFVILSDKCYNAIQDYQATRGAIAPDAPLFACHSNNNKNGRMTTRSISAIAREYLDAIGLEERQYTAHSLRHTCACLMIENNVPDKMVQLTLRHASPVTTQIYTHHVEEHRRIELAAESILDQII